MASSHWSGHVFSERQVQAPRVSGDRLPKTPVHSQYSLKFCKVTSEVPCSASMPRACPPGSEILPLGSQGGFAHAQCPPQAGRGCMCVVPSTATVSPGPHIESCRRPDLWSPRHRAESGRGWPQLRPWASLSLAALLELPEKSWDRGQGLDYWSLHFPMCTNGHLSFRQHLRTTC